MIIPGQTIFHLFGQRHKVMEQLEFDFKEPKVISDKLLKLMLEIHEESKKWHKHVLDPYDLNEVAGFRRCKDKGVTHGRK